ncbi:MAG: hypothetical protein ACYCRH_08170 [Acidiferrobacteraceae bacterium]
MARKMTLGSRDTAHPFGQLHPKHLRAIAERLDVSETKAVDIAVGRLYAPRLDPEDFDVPSDAALAAAERRLRRVKVGPIVRVRSLSDYFEKRPTPRRRRKD